MLPTLSEHTITTGCSAFLWNPHFRNPTIQKIPTSWEYQEILVSCWLCRPAAWNWNPASEFWNEPDEISFSCLGPGISAVVPGKCSTNTCHTALSAPAGLGWHWCLTITWRVMVMEQKCNVVLVLVQFFFLTGVSCTCTEAEGSSSTLCKQIAYNGQWCYRGASGATRSRS